MSSIAMFFPDFHRAGLGRKRLSASSKLARQTRQLDACCLAELDVLLGHALPSWLRLFKASSGANSRKRMFTVAVTFWTFLLQVLDADGSCRSALAHVHALCAAKNKPSLSDSTAAYCKARRRLPASLLIGVLRHITQIVVRAAGDFNGDGGRLLVMDGTTITLQDSDANRAVYHYASGQKPGCGFPQMHLLGLFDLRSGAWLRVVKSAQRRHDSFLAWKLVGHLRAGDTLIADRAFCSYAFIHQCEARGVHVVMRLHQARARTLDMAKGKSLGRGDSLHNWMKPKSKELRDLHPARYAALPDELEMRVIAVQTITRGRRPEAMYFATTLRDAKAHSAQAIATLYLRRWNVELFFDDIKTSQKMDMLRCKSPAMVARELLMHMIAYNLVRVLLVQAEAQRPAGQDGRLSFKGTLDRLHHWHSALWGNPSRKAVAKCYSQMIEDIANDVVLPRPGRYEPRLVKRRRDSYSLLTRPRAELRRVPAPPKHRSKAA
jgi:hypothetical protein